MQNNNIIFIDLDLHKVSTQVAYSKDICSAEASHLGKFVSKNNRTLSLPVNFDQNTRK
ncbi:MAG: hypothetical protein ACI9ES_002401 [Oceanospirillaceae bacterium]|jgi:hypothetical protein